MDHTETKMKPLFRSFQTHDNSANYKFGTVSNYLSANLDLF